MMKLFKNFFFMVVGFFALYANVIAADDRTYSVIINDKALSNNEIQQLAASFGGQVFPGRYWYDRKTGGWGRQCGPGLGIGQAGLALGGELKADASCGNTGVFINGRELHAQDLMLLQSLSGYIAPGRYWMDAQLNAGVEGGPALVNYRALASKSNQSNDNFWSSRYGAGNSNSDNSQGYVNVPGHGPVGYGY